MTGLRIPWAKPEFTGREQHHLQRALESTWISGGAYVDQFENDFKRAIGAPYGITVANGTAALHVAMLALDLGRGDEVIVPGYTFVAPANMALAVGAQPVFADIDPDTWCIDPSAVAHLITPATKAIVAVHLYGNLCDMDTLAEIARRHHLALIEDTAEAAFSKYKGRHGGTLGDLGCFSFQATKTLTMGEGGFVATPSAELESRMRLRRDHGMRPGKRYWHDVVGYNYRLTNLQAAVGIGQLEAIERILALRRSVYARYVAHLSGAAGVTLQHFRPEVEPIVWAVAVRIDPDAFRLTRDEIIGILWEQGIETRPGFYPLSAMPPYHAPPSPVAHDVAAHILCLPSFPSLTESEIGETCDALLELRR